MRTGRSYTVCRSLLPGGGLLPGGVLHAQGRFSMPGEVLHAWGGGFSMPGGVLHAGGVSMPGGGVLHGGGVWSWGGSPCQTPSPVNRMTDRCKNITLAKTSFRPVSYLSQKFLIRDCYPLSGNDGWVSVFICYWWKRHRRQWSPLYCRIHGNVASISRFGVYTLRCTTEVYSVRWITNFTFPWHNSDSFIRVKP